MKLHDLSRRFLGDAAVLSVACFVCLAMHCSDVNIGFPGLGRVLASTNFNTGKDGWSMASRANGDSFEWTQTEGRFGTPAIMWNHWSHGTALYFAAGPAFLGDMSTAFRGVLRFELLSEKIIPTSGQPLVILDGPNGLRIATGFESTPRGWQSHAISLDESGDWINMGEQRSATSDEIAEVLGDLVNLRIRGVSGPAILDNVSIAAGPGVDAAK